MNRRSFLRQAGAAAGVTTGLAAPAVAQAPQELRMVLSWPKGSPGLGLSAQRLAARFEAATEGRYRIRVFGGGELVPALKGLDAVQQGTADLYHSADYYYIGKSPAFGFFTTVPFGLTPAEMHAWLHHGGGQALWDALSAEFGVKPLACGNTGSQMGGWFRRPMASLEDFKGLRMRIPGLAGDVIKALGGTTVTLAVADILPALQSGAIDAAEWVGPWNDLAFGFYKVARHYHYPGFHEPGPVLSLGVRRALWEGMTAGDRAILEACAVAECQFSLAEFNANNAAALETLVKQHGVELHEFSDEIFKAAGDAARDVLAAAAGTDPMTRKVHDSFMAFRKSALAWSKLSDQSYMQKRELSAW